MHKINVTKTFLPPIEEYSAQAKRAFDNGWLTNRGELVVELEKKIADFLELTDSKVILMNNGTIPLQIALKLFGEGGEVITTPFSYVATTSSIVWEGCEPVFVDIHMDNLTIDESKIERAITDKTTCILATHVFGNPCNVIEIERIAKKHNLKVIYDGAHAFGVKYNGKSIFEYGDISTCSFHATKLFHTGEGGAAFCKDDDLYNRLFYSHNFGHKGPVEFQGLGINGKLSELHAAMGLAVLPYLNLIIEERKKCVDFYLNKVPKKFLRFLINNNVQWNYSYFPILFEDEQQLTQALKELNDHNIYPRRYFYPSLNNLPYLGKQQMPISDSIAKRIVCLPLFHDLKEKDIELISQIIIKYA